MRSFLLLLAGVMLPAFGQTTAQYPNIPQSLVRYFSLTADQAGSIRSLNMNLSDFISAKYKRLDELDDLISRELSRTSPDSNQVGQMVVEMNQIDRDISAEVVSTVSKVQALLTDDQKGRVKALEDALRLSGTILQAESWAFLVPPDLGSSGTGFLLTATPATESAPALKLSRSLMRKAWSR